MSLIAQTKAAFQLYRLLLTDYYKQEAPYRLLDVTSHFFPVTNPFCQRIIEYTRGKTFEILSDETLKEEKWAQLKKTIEEVKQLFGIEDEIIIARDLSEIISRLRDFRQCYFCKRRKSFFSNSKCSKVCNRT